VSERGKSGIYAITNTVNGKRYVGQASSIGLRWSGHKSCLIRGSHVNQKLQRSWLKYGEAAFEFTVLEYVERHRLTEREAHWFAVLKPEFNLAPAAGSNRGMRLSERHKAALLKANTGRVVSEETRRRIGDANRVRMTGRKQTADIVEKRIAPLRGRPRPAHVVETLHAALRASRQPVIDAIVSALKRDIGINQTHLAAELRCGRATIRKYKALVMRGEV
jgi:group I intron endonuclease